MIFGDKFKNEREIIEVGWGSGWVEGGRERGWILWFCVWFRCYIIVFYVGGFICFGRFFFWFWGSGEFIVSCCIIVVFEKKREREREKFRIVCNGFCDV